MYLLLPVSAIHQVLLWYFGCVDRALCPAMAFGTTDLHIAACIGHPSITALETLDVLIVRFARPWLLAFFLLLTTGGFAPACSGVASSFAPPKPFAVGVNARPRLLANFPY